MLANLSGAPFETNPLKKRESEYRGPISPHFDTLLRSRPGQRLSRYRRTETLSEKKTIDMRPHHSVRDFATVGVRAA
jgi:hypothetical protein